MSNGYVPFSTPLLVDQHSGPWPIDAGTSPPSTANPVHVGIPCNIRLPKPSEVQSIVASVNVTCDLVIGFAPRPAGSATRYYSTFDATNSLGSGKVQSTIFELPPKSGQLWIVLRSVIVARSYVNEHKNCYVTKGWPNQSVEKN